MDVAVAANAMSMQHVTFLNPQGRNGCACACVPRIVRRSTGGHVHDKALCEVWPGLVMSYYHYITIPYISVRLSYSLVLCPRKWNTSFGPIHT